MASKTFLEIVVATAEKCGATAPSTVVLQTGEKLRFVNWVNDAYRDILTMHEDWQFLETAFSFATTTQQATYTPAQAGITDFGAWKQDSVRISTTSASYADEMLAPYMEYATWRNLYQYANMRTTYTRPVIFTITPDKQLGLGPAPDATGFTINGRYFKYPADMSGDTDVPVIPDKYWRAIMYRAMMAYGTYESAPEVYSDGEKNFKHYMARMNVDQIVSIETGNPLA